MAHVLCDVNNLVGHIVLLPGGSILSMPHRIHTPLNSSFQFSPPGPYIQVQHTLITFPNGCELSDGMSQKIVGRHTNAQLTFTKLT